MVTLQLELFIPLRRFVTASGTTDRNTLMAHLMPCWRYPGWRESLHFGPVYLPHLVGLSALRTELIYLLFIISSARHPHHRHLLHNVRAAQGKDQREKKNVFPRRKYNGSYFWGSRLDDMTAFQFILKTPIFTGWVSLTAGGLARLIAVTLVSPLELTR